MDYDTNIEIDFFQKEGALDIGSIFEGVYMVDLQHNHKPTEGALRLYIGQSVYMLKRGGEHLWTLIKEPIYFGLTLDDLRNSNLRLRFSVLEYLPDSTETYRKEKEVKYIMQFQPLTQMPQSHMQIRKKLDVVQEQIRLLAWNK